MQTTKPRIIYVYDALCGWCYGFSPVIRRLYQTRSDEFDFDVLSGGMMAGDRARPIAELRTFIEQAYRTVEDHTGVQFSEYYLTDILQSDTYISDSEKPGMAMTLFKAVLPDRAIEFAGILQHALYRKGLDLNVDANYGPLVEPFGIDPDEYVAHLSDSAIKRQTWAEFDLVANYGINGFPSVILDNGSKLFLIARGYLSYEQFEQNITRALESV
ncbi:DsbA family protein [Spirosoma taeanense]|uniref:DsbA family protein n=1 Tax=Spirosoma taeanense TaxID=2735870 RepID=A0A6M5Y7W9_9BACT|nr:DsbA family protein [Spirosoma taeanense]QJW90427.1 DsbA family protein [Spirosoma taeanense]